MNKLFTYIIILLFAVLPMLTSADEDNHNISVDQMMTEIMQVQDVSSPSDVDCKTVTDDEFERLGEAVMSVMHPDPKQHELMDQMMGGEGSEQLRAMHINMGQNYLDCGSGGFGMMNGSMMGGMIGSGMIGGGGKMSGFSPKVGAGFNSSANNAGDLGRYSMMGIPYMGASISSGSWIFMILFWILVVLGIIWLIKSLVGKNTSQGKTPEALEILKSRYAKGEITKEEFERIKKDLI